jgi:peptidoglycan/LPS O-acetylase OafA/YrhL
VVTVRDVTTRRSELDGLRGVSVLLVVLSHASNRGLHLAPGLDFSGLGRTGVFLFFVLSSYLLTDQLLARGAAELRQPRTWLRYAARRLLRVYPGYFLALGVTLALGGLTLPNALLHLALVRAEAHFWTIPVEVLFYLVLPPLALVLTALPRASMQVALLAFGLVAARLVWPPDYPAKAPDFRPSVLPFLVVFLAGSLTAVLARTGWLTREGRVARALLPLGCLGFARLTPALAGLVLGEHVEHTRYHLWFGTQAALASLVVLGLVVHGGWAKRVLSNAPLCFVGRASYSVYLLHALPLAYVLERGPQSVAGAWVILGASLVLGAAAYLFVERPFLRA